MTEVPENPDELELEKGSVEMTLKDVYVMFYTLLAQNQKLHPGSKMAFDLNVFKNMPKKLSISFERKDGKLLVWIPKKPKDRKKKSRLHLPEHEIVTPN